MFYEINISILYDVSIIIIYISTLFAIIYKIAPETKDYQTLLEFPTNYILGMEDITDDPTELLTRENNLIQIMNSYCEEHYIYEKGVIVSLSGGVDSMVILACLIRLQNLHSFTINAVFINYNLRKESNMEMEFLSEYLKTYGIDHYIISIEDIKRKSQQDNCSRREYEEWTKHIRYNAYKKIMERYDLTGVMVGHHQDDIIENIFTNTMYGRSVLDLEVMKSKSVIKGVPIMRPFLRLHKKEIYDYAHMYNIPYFLDTTPKWSKRGKMRFEIFPLITRTFGNGWRNKIKKIGKESTFWGNFIDEHIEESINKCSTIEYITILDNPEKTKITFYLEYMKDFMKTPQYFHKMISIIMHSNGYKMFSNRGVNNIIKLFNGKEHKISLNKNWFVSRKDDKIFIYN
jgi:tRNA(Ile)-lysidine synthetase-like protein